MKKIKLAGDGSMADASIDQYCQSVADLLKNINEKAGASPCVLANDESQFMDYSDEMFQY